MARAGADFGREVFGARPFDRPLRQAQDTVRANGLGAMFSRTWGGTCLALGPSTGPFVRLRTRSGRAEWGLRLGGFGAIGIGGLKPNGLDGEGWGGLWAGRVRGKALRQAQGERMGGDALAIPRLTELGGLKPNGLGGEGWGGLGAGGVLRKALRQAQGERSGGYALAD